MNDNTKVDATPPVGLVPALSSVVISITLCALAPGDIQAICKVNIAGVEVPFDLNLFAHASGPRLKVEPKELNWGKVRNRLMRQPESVSNGSELEGCNNNGSCLSDILLFPFRILMMHGHGYLFSAQERCFVC